MAYQIPAERNSAPAPAIASEVVDVTGKTFTLELKENHRGRFLRVTEERAGRRNAVILSTKAADEVVEALRRLSLFASELPPFEGETVA